jgi:hypothetical protein
MGLTQPPIMWVKATLTPRIMRPVREVDRGPLGGAEDKNNGAVSPRPSIFMAWSLPFIGLWNVHGTRTEFHFGGGGVLLY